MSIFSEYCLLVSQHWFRTYSKSRLMKTLLNEIFIRILKYVYSSKITLYIAAYVEYAFWCSSRVPPVSQGYVSPYPLYPIVSPAASQVIEWSCAMKCAVWLAVIDWPGFPGVPGAGQRPISQTFLQGQNSYSLYPYLDSVDPIRSEFCTCHDSSAVVACAKFWRDPMIISCCFS